MKNKLKEEYDNKLKEEYDNLSNDFNINYELDIFELNASKRTDMSRIWSKKLLKISFYINILSILFLLAGTVLVALRPNPSYYAATPNGMVYPLNNVTNQVK